MRGFKGNESWVIRRALYGVGFIVSVVVVLTGAADIQEVEGWFDYVDQLAGVITAVATGLATVKTGPNSDNTATVVPVEQVLDVVQPSQGAFGEVAPATGRAFSTPLDMVRGELEKRE